MTDQTLRIAFHDAIRQTEDDEKLGIEALALMQAIDFSLEAWCRVLELDPTDPATIASWDTIHDSYAKTWKQAGQEGFIRMMQDRVEKWTALWRSR